MAVAFKFFIFKNSSVNDYQIVEYFMVKKIPNRVLIWTN